MGGDLTRGSLYMQLHIPLKEVTVRRREIESKLMSLLELNRSEIKLKDIQDIIYNEEEMDDLKRIIRIFDNGFMAENEIVLNIMNDA